MKFLIAYFLHLTSLTSSDSTISEGLAYTGYDISGFDTYWNGLSLTTEENSIGFISSSLISSLTSSLGIGITGFSSIISFNFSSSF